jgi:hypothetical protein
MLVLVVAATFAARADVKVVSVHGDVKVRRGAEEQWRAVTPGEIVKPEDSMMSGRGATAVLSIDGASKVALPEMVIVDCADLRSLTQEELLLKLAMEGIRALPQQKKDVNPSIPRTTTVHGEKRDGGRPVPPGGIQGYALQLNGTKVLHQHGYYATMVLRAKEVLRLAPQLKKRTDVRLMVADSFERMSLASEALTEYRALSKEKLSDGDRALVERKIEELRKKQKG